MRLVVVTGTGGAGRTTVAAATAVRAAHLGHKTLVWSTEPALSHTLSAPLGPDVTEVDSGLFAVRREPVADLERAWDRLRHRPWAGWAATLAGLRPAELAVPPGLDDPLALLDLRHQIAGGRFDVIVVDAPPVAAALRLLTAADTLAWYLDRLVPAHQRVLRSIRPSGRGRTDPVSLLCAELAEARAALAGTELTVRLVVAPEAGPVAEARGALPGLALHGYRVDQVVVNRVTPPAPPGAGTWWTPRAERHATAVADLRADPPAPVRVVADRGAAPAGTGELAAFAEELYGGDDPAEPVPTGPVDRVEPDGAQFVWHLPVAVPRGVELTLGRSGTDLVVTVGEYRRLLPVPPVLRRCVPVRATRAAGWLRIRFRPDPDAWPARLTGAGEWSHDG